jgi:hypothetical protein
MFLTQRKMKVVIDGDVSKEATVDSGVPQGTVLGPLLLFEVQCMGYFAPVVGCDRSDCSIFGSCFLC